VTTLAKADKVAKQQGEKEKTNEQASEQKEAKAVKASTAAEPTPTPQEPEQTEQVLTETWSYQLPADE
jgi:glucans biosynthesis protein